MKALFFTLALAIALPTFASKRGVSDGGGEEGGPFLDLYCEYTTKTRTRIAFEIEQDTDGAGFAASQVMYFTKFVGEAETEETQIEMTSKVSFQDSKTKEGILPIVLVYTGEGETKIVVDPNGKHNPDLAGRQFEFNGTLTSANPFFGSHKETPFKCTVHH